MTTWGWIFLGVMTCYAACCAVSSRYWRHKAQRLQHDLDLQTLEVGYLYKDASKRAKRDLLWYVQHQSLTKGES